MSCDSLIRNFNVAKSSSCPVAVVVQFNLGYFEAEQPSDRGLVKPFRTVHRH